MVPFERAIVVSLALHCDHCTISNHSTTICHPMSPTLKLTVGDFGSKRGEEGVDRCKPNFEATWKRHGAVVRKRNRADIFSRLSTMHERDRQTSRDHGTVTSILKYKLQEEFNYETKISRDAG